MFGWLAFKQCFQQMVIVCLQSKTDGV